MARHGVRHALAATLVVAALVLSACSGDSGTPAADPTSGGPDRSASGTTAAPTIEDNHTVPPPGPRQPGVLAPADILVTRADTIDKATVRAIKHVKGVTSVTVISLSEATIENQALTVAAVDPAAYRTFVPQRYAEFEEAWDRVAGGELALKERLKDKVPLDAEGYLKLGGATDAPS